MKETLQKVLEAVQPLGYNVEADEAEGTLLVKMRCEKGSTGPVLQAALATGAIIRKTRVSPAGYQLFID
jgi:hypothetical protein